MSIESSYTEYIADNWTAEEQPCSVNLDKLTIEEKLTFAIKIIIVESNSDIDPAVRVKAVEKCYQILQVCENNDILKIGLEILLAPIPPDRKPFKFTFTNGHSISLPWYEMEVLKRKSEYFKALDDKKMLEGIQREVILDEVEPYQFIQLLGYVLHPELMQTPQQAYEALVLGNKFSLDLPRCIPLVQSIIDQMNFDDLTKDDLEVLKQIMLVNDHFCTKILDSLPVKNADILYELHPLNSPKIYTSLNGYIQKIVLQPSVSLDFSKLNIQKLELGLCDTAQFSNLMFATTLQHLTLSIKGISRFKQMRRLYRLKYLKLQTKSGRLRMDGINGLGGLEHLVLSNVNLSLMNLSWMRQLRLRQLNLSSCEIKGKLNQEQNNWSNLQGLHLEYIHDFFEEEEVEKFSNLQHLGLVSQNVKKLEKITELPKLVSLDLSRNKGLNFAYINTMTALTRLVLTHVDLTSLNAIGRLQSLQHIDVSHNPIQTLEGIEKFTCLQSLALHSPCNKIKFAGIEKLTRLQHLEVIASLQSFNEIVSLTQLLSLNIKFNCTITDLAGIEKFTKLQKLNVEFTKVSPSDIPYINDTVKILHRTW